MAWNKINCCQRELQLLGTLNGGQSFRYCMFKVTLVPIWHVSFTFNNFRWNYNKDTNEWKGVFSRTLWKLRQQDDFLEYQVLGSLLIKSKENNSVKVDFADMLTKYFRLDFNLKDHYKVWSDKDELFKSACTKFYGIRMLNQEPVENLFSFICSQNNHISRYLSIFATITTCIHSKLFKCLVIKDIQPGWKTLHLLWWWNLSVWRSDILCFSWCGKAYGHKSNIIWHIYNINILKFVYYSVI